MRHPRFVASAALLIAALAGGCSMMPAAGPASSVVAAGVSTEPDGLPFAVVKLNPQAVDILATNAPRLSTAFLDKRAPKEIRFGIGDVVSVTIFEAAAGGLFIP